MKRRTAILSSLYLPFVLVGCTQGTRYGIKLAGVKPEIVDMSKEYKNLSYETRAEQDYEQIMELAREHRNGRKEGGNFLDYLDRIAGLSGVEVKDLDSYGYGVKMIRYGKGKNKLVSIYNLVKSENAFRSVEPSAIFPWIESVKVSRDIFDPSDVSYIALTYYGPNSKDRQVINAIENEAKDSKLVLSLKGESPYPIGGLRIFESSFGCDGFNNRNINREKITREVERMAFETETPLHNFSTGKIFDPDRDKDRHERIILMEEKGRDPVFDKDGKLTGARETLMSETEWRYKIKVFSESLRIQSLYGNPTEPDEISSNIKYNFILKFSDVLLSGIYPSNTYFEARVEVPGMWDMKRKELTHNLTDMALLNVEL